MELSRRGRRNLEALLFFLAGGLMLALLPDEWLLPFCGAVMGIGFSGLFGVRAYLARLERVAASLGLDPADAPPVPVTAGLGKLERTFLGLDASMSVEIQIAVVRGRQDMLLSFGVFLGSAAMCALLVLVIAFGDDG